jgi:hypothetical protein
MLLASAFALLAAGCGLKAPLSLPEKSESVIIRGAEGTPAGEGTAAPSAPAPSETQAAPPSAPAAPATPTTQPPAATSPAKDDKPPPPPLPGGNPGTSRGG